MNRLLATIGFVGGAIGVTMALLGGLGIVAAAQRGDLLPQIHWSTAR